MFEKEAEEHANQFMKTHTESDKYINCKRETDNYNVMLAQGYELGFQKGAEFGFNKANEWHFVDKERLPEDKCKVLVQNVNGDYDIAFNFVGTWRGTSGNELRGAYAWKEIIPPKES